MNNEIKTFLDNLHHAYGQTDGSYDFPNSREGDMLKQAKKIFESMLPPVEEATENSIPVEFTKKCPTCNGTGFRQLSGSQIGAVCGVGYCSLCSGSGKVFDIKAAQEDQ